MSVLKVNNISNLNNNGAPQFSNGMTISGGKTITGNISLTGVCTATSFSGDGSGITVEGGASNSKIFGIVYIT